MSRNILLIKIITVILVISLCVPVGAQAVIPEAMVPRASDYLAVYTAYICAMGNGNLEIWFDITGTGTCADIGVLSILLYESTDNNNWYWVETFRHTDYPNMLSHNDFYCMDYVEYEGVPGRYYKASVCIWAGPEDTGDTRYMWTEVERCT